MDANVWDTARPKPLSPTYACWPCDAMHSIIKFFALDRLLPWVVAVSTDPARDSALPHPSSLGQLASYRHAIVRGPLRLVRLKFSSSPMGLERAPMAWRCPCFLENLRPSPLCARISRQRLGRAKKPLGE